MGSGDWQLMEAYRVTSQQVDCGAEGSLPPEFQDEECSTDSPPPNEFQNITCSPMPEMQWERVLLTEATVPADARVVVACSVVVHDDWQGFPEGDNSIWVWLLHTPSGEWLVQDWHE